MKLELKKRIVKTLIWSTVLYAAETWTLESGHSTTGIVQNVDLEKVNENQLGFSPRRGDTLDQHYTLHGGKMKLELKKRIVKTLIWSTVLYAAETWTLESGHSTTGIVQNVDLEKVNENKLD